MNTLCTQIQAECGLTHAQAKTCKNAKFGGSQDKSPVHTHVEQTNVRGGQENVKMTKVRKTCYNHIYMVDICIETRIKKKMSKENFKGIYSN